MNDWESLNQNVSCDNQTQKITTKYLKILHRNEETDVSLGAPHDAISKPLFVMVFLSSSQTHKMHRSENGKYML